MASTKDRMSLQELLHNIQIDIALICEINLPTGFVWRNPGYRTYNIRDPNPIYDGTAVLLKSNIQHAIFNIPMLKSLQASAILVEFYGLKTVIGAVYQNQSKPLEEYDLDILIESSMSKIFMFVGDLNSKNMDWNTRPTSSRSRKLARREDSTITRSPRRIVQLTIQIGYERAS